MEDQMKIDQVNNLLVNQVVVKKDLYQMIITNKEIKELNSKVNLSNDIIKLFCMIMEETLKFHRLVRKKKKDIKEKICYRCQSKGHLAKYCINQVTCKICAENHWTKWCPKKICDKCKKRHKEGQCKVANQYCRWCNKFSVGHESKNCPYAMPIKRIMKMEKVILKTRSKSIGKFRFRGKIKRYRKRFRK